MIRFKEIAPAKRTKQAKVKKPTKAQINALKAAIGTGDLKSPKKLVSLRLDQDVVFMLKSINGEGWTSKVNSVLRTDLGI